MCPTVIARVLNCRVELIKFLVHASGNITFSSNKIKSFTEYLDDYDADFNYIGQQAVKHKNTDISFSPNNCSSYNNIYSFKKYAIEFC